MRTPVHQELETMRYINNVRKIARQVRSRMGRGFLPAQRRPLPRPVALFCHHKVGTELLSKTFGSISRRMGWRFATLNGQKTELAADADVMLYAHSLIDPFGITKPFAGMHLVRDPRDIIISGYLYHQRTTEAWCTNTNFQQTAVIDFPQVPYSQRWRSESWKRDYLRLLAGRSYQEHLMSLPQNEGILFEMDRYAGWTIQSMASWNYGHPSILELRFEDLMAHYDDNFRRIFQSIGMLDDDIEVALKLAAAHDLSRKDDETIRRMKHVSSPQPQKWRKYFDDELKTAFRKRFGNILIDLGYETSHSW